MGCDGGTIPRRDELVRTKKKPEQKDKDCELSFRWRHCAISQQPLQNPIVACGLGRMYNKETVIEALLDKSNVPEVAKHIKNLKDVKELKLTPNPAFKLSAEKGDAYIDHQCAPFICPVIGLEMNGKFKFVFLWSCGCVFSERALKAIKTKTCHKCLQPFAEEDVVILNAAEEEFDLMKLRMEGRQARLKAEKKAKSEAKAKIKKEPPSPEASCSRNPDPLPNGVTVKEEAVKLGLKVGINVEGSRTLNGKAKRAGTSVPEELEDPAFKKTKGNYSVAKDPNATSVFKSLFTSSTKASSQTKAHWVTYNPFYN